MEDKSKRRILFVNPKVVDINGKGVIDWDSIFGNGNKFYSIVCATPGRTSDKPIVTPDLKIVQPEE